MKDQTSSCWLLFEKSEETRVSQGFSLYGDKTGVCYRFDSLVPNFKRIKSGDFVVLRKENEIIGTAFVGAIYQENGLKAHRRCPIPGCGSTDIRLRKNLLPKFRCGKAACGAAFDAPLETSVEVTLFEAEIINYSPLDHTLSVASVKTCSTTKKGPQSQLSILQLDRSKLEKIMNMPRFDDLIVPIGSGRCGQGFGLSIAERKAVELHAMAQATDHYRAGGWTVTTFGAMGVGGATGASLLQPVMSAASTSAAVTIARFIG